MPMTTSLPVGRSLSILLRHPYHGPERITKTDISSSTHQPQKTKERQTTGWWLGDDVWIDPLCTLLTIDTQAWTSARQWERDEDRAEIVPMPVPLSSASYYCPARPQ